MGGIEYNDGGCVEKTKKEKVPIQAKFYNEKFPLVYESPNIGDSLS